MALDLIKQPTTPTAAQILDGYRRAFAQPKHIEIENKSGVCIVVIHEGQLVNQAARFIQSNHEQGAKALLYKEPRQHNHENKIVEKYLNCSAARNRAKEHAMKKTDCEWFVFLDADVAPPINAIDHFLMMREEVCGGWYPIKNCNRWVAGRWVGDNTFQTATKPRRNVIDWSDMTPLGCCMIHRSVLEVTEFRPGCDLKFKEAGADNYGFLGECLDFGNQLHELGSLTWMAPGVVCQHLDFGSDNKVEIHKQKTNQKQNGYSQTNG